MRRLIVTLIVGSISSCFCLGQSNSVAAEFGFKPYGSYDWQDIDTVNLLNLSLNVRIPIASFPQRGGTTFSFSVVYREPILQYKLDGTNCNPLDPRTCNIDWSLSGAGNGGIDIVPDNFPESPFVDANGTINFMMSDGTSHAHVPAGTWVQDGSGYFVAGTRSSTGCVILGTTFYDEIVVITDPKGTRYTYHAPFPNSPTCSGPLTSIEDINGNEITPNSTVYNGVQLQTSFTDTLGRNLGFPNFWNTNTTSDLTGCTGSLPMGSTAYTWTVPGPNGATDIYKMCLGIVTINLPNCQNANGQTTTRCIFHPNGTAVQSIVLPNGTAWTFGYDSWNGNSSTYAFGDLTQITFPTGGTISYAWNTVPVNSVPCQTGPPWWARGIQSRTVNTNDGQGPHQYSYTSVVASGSNPTVTTTVRDPMGNTSVHTLSDVENNCTYYETMRQDKQLQNNSQVLVRTVATQYNTSGYPPLPATITTTWPNGQVSQVQKQYDSPAFGNVTSLLELDYGPNAPGVPLRKTVTTFKYQTAGAYQTNNLIHLPASITTEDGSGTVQEAKTTFGYDEYGLVSTSVIQHDTAPVTGAARGNQTSISRWLNTNNSFLSSTKHYYDSGTVEHSTDALGHNTAYRYSTTYQGAYPTTITNTLSQSITSTYDFNCGLLTSITDANLQPTNYNYDNMARITSISNPDGGNTTYGYDDQLSRVTTTTVIDNTITPPYSTSTTTLMNGLGQVTQVQLTTDPQGTDFTDTTYDGVRRVWKQSNAHRSSSSPTDGITTHLYDALGRLCLTVPADVTTVPTSCPTSAPAGDVFSSYTGNCTTVTDEAGKTRKSCADALGRITQVFEDPIVLNYETDYGYDVLNNLVSVTQNGSGSAGARVRTFTYDSLSRLLCASNPETSSAACTAAALNGYITGTTGYNYDANGNVSKRTAPLHNQTGTATVATNYQYDALNRLVSKSYTDGTSSVQYGYDGSALAGCTTAPPSLSDPSPIGRRTAMCDGSGATSWSHDPMGRIASETRTIRGNSAVTKTTTYQYNVDGSLNELTYGGGTTLNYAYDQAQHQNFVADLINNIGYVDSATFAPPGLMTGFVGGTTASFSGITSAFNYNKRLQPTAMSATTSASTIFSLGYTYGPTGKDNGNISTITNNLDSTRTVNFTYDSLNRIANALTTNWGEAYTIDAWGNMTAINSYQGKAHENLSCGPANTQNRLNTCYGYDSAGDLIQNGSATYTYDAEGRLSATAGVTYVYDGGGNRVKKSSTAGTLYWPDTAGRVLSETDLTGASKSDYVFFNGQRIARFDPTTLAVHYYFSNHLGSHTVVTNATGTCEQDIEYYPYGGQTKQYCSTPVAQNYKFTGKERDSESGLDNFGARYFGSSLGRFMTPDWSANPQGVPYAVLGDPQSMNLYAYVRNNPLNRTDPTGHCDSGGQKQSFWWCVGHALGFNETKEEAAVRIANERNWLINNVARNSGQVNALRGASASQVHNVYQLWDQAIIRAQCPPFWGCETYSNASAFQRAENGALLYRGGDFSNVRANEYKLDADGNVRSVADPTSRGPSLFEDPAKIPPRFTEINPVTQDMLPPELVTKPWGQAGHFELVPREPGMSPGRFLDLLRGILEDPIEE
jgi:RHS repeat-associated protein